jgi:hypothetical protein
MPGERRQGRRRRRASQGREEGRSACRKEDASPAAAPTKPNGSAASTSIPDDVKAGTGADQGWRKGFRLAIGASHRQRRRCRHHGDFRFGTARAHRQGATSKPRSPVARKPLLPPAAPAAAAAPAGPSTDTVLKLSRKAPTNSSSTTICARRLPSAFRNPSRRSRTSTYRSIANWTRCSSCGRN